MKIQKEKRNTYEDTRWEEEVLVAGGHVEDGEAGVPAHHGHLAVCGHHRVCMLAVAPPESQVPG